MTLPSVGKKKKTTRKTKGGQMHTVLFFRLQTLFCLRLFLFFSLKKMLERKIINCETSASYSEHFSIDSVSLRRWPSTTLIPIEASFSPVNSSEQALIMSSDQVAISLFLPILFFCAHVCMHKVCVCVCVRGACVSTGPVSPRCPAECLRAPRNSV